MNSLNISKKIATIAAVLQLSGCAIGSMSQMVEEKAAKQVGEVMKADGYSDKEIEQFQMKLKNRDGLSQVWKERMSNDSNRLKTEGAGTSFSVIDSEYDRTCGFSGDYGTQLRNTLNKGSGLLFPAYSIGTDGSFIYDESRTLRMHKAMSAIGMKLLPVSESRKFHSIALQYMKKLATLESKNAEKTGLAAMASAISTAARATTTSEAYRTPFNTIDYFNEVLIKFPNASYTIGDSSEEAALTKIKFEYYLNMLGASADDSIMGAPIDYQYASKDVKSIAAKAVNYSSIAAHLNSSGAHLQVTPMSEYKNRTQTPGVKLRSSGYCIVESYSAQLAGFEIKDKERKELDKVGSSMTTSMLTFGWSNMADLVKSKTNDAELKEKAMRELDESIKSFQEARIRADEVYYSQLIPFIPKAFKELQVSGFTKSSRLK